MNATKKQSLGKTYAQIIKFGRLLENHQKAKEFTDDHPEVVMAFVDSIDRQLLWTSTDDFFSAFTPIKRYSDDGRWDYHSTMRMRKEQLGSHFGTGDFKDVIMSACHENKYLKLVGLSFTWSISRSHKKKTGRSLLMDFLNSNGTGGVSND